MVRLLPSALLALVVVAAIQRRPFPQSPAPRTSIPTGAIALASGSEIPARPIESARTDPAPEIAVLKLQLREADSKLDAYRAKLVREVQAQGALERAAHELGYVRQRNDDLSAELEILKRAYAER
jgi:hypothetical protein